MTREHPEPKEEGGDVDNPTKPVPSSLRWVRPLVSFVVLAAAIFGIFYLFTFKLVPQAFVGDNANYSMQNIPFVIAVLIVTGGLGGLVISFLENGRKFEIPSIQSSHIRLGSLADLLIGITSALGVFFLLAGTIEFRGFGGLFRLVGVGILAGLAGNALLPKLKERFIDRINQLQRDIKAGDDATNSRVLHALGLAYLGKNDLENSEYCFKDALTVNPNQYAAYAGLAHVYKKRAQLATNPDRKNELFERALRELDIPLTRSPKKAGLYVTRASIKYDMDKPSFEIQDDLQRAVNDDREIKNFILEEDEHRFERFSGESWFRELIG